LDQLAPQRISPLFESHSLDGTPLLDGSEHLVEDPQRRLEHRPERVHHDEPSARRGLGSVSPSAIEGITPEAFHGGMAARVIMGSPSVRSSGCVLQELGDADAAGEEVLREALLKEVEL
jgi:hypothetical protein